MNHFEHTIFDLLPENIAYIAFYLSDVYEMHNLFNVSKTMQILMKNKVKELWGLGNIILYPFQIEFIDKCITKTKHKNMFISEDCSQYDSNYCMSMNNAVKIQESTLFNCEKNESCNCLKLYESRPISKSIKCNFSDFIIPTPMSRKKYNVIEELNRNICENTTSHFRPPSTLYIEHGKRVTILATINRLKQRKNLFDLSPNGKGLDLKDSPKSLSSPNREGLNMALLITEDETRLKWERDIELCGLSHMFSQNVEDFDKGLVYYGFNNERVEEALKMVSQKRYPIINDDNYYESETEFETENIKQQEFLNLIPCESDLSPRVKSLIYNSNPVIDILFVDTDINKLCDKIGTVINACGPIPTLDNNYNCSIYELLDIFKSMKVVSTCILTDRRDAKILISDSTKKLKTTYKYISGDMTSNINKIINSELISELMDFGVKESEIIDKKKVFIYGDISEELFDELSQVENVIIYVEDRNGVRCLMNIDNDQKYIESNNIALSKIDEFDTFICPNGPYQQLSYHLKTVTNKHVTIYVLSESKDRLLSNRMIGLQLDMHETTKMLRAKRQISKLEVALFEILNIDTDLFSDNDVKLIAGISDFEEWEKSNHNILPNEYAKIIYNTTKHENLCYY